MADVRCPVLVGREGEVESLTARLERARAKDGGVVLVAGEAGIGKSRLLAEVRTAAHGSGMVVLAGRAVERASAPFRPLSEALLPAWVEHEQASDAARDPLADVLARLWGAGEPLEGGDMERLALGEAATRFLGRVAGDAGCLLVLEDLHWADLDTLGVVEYLADHLAGTRVLCLAGVRTGEGSPGEAWARDLAARRLAHLVSVDRLRSEQVRAMATACLGGDDLPDDLVSFLGKRSEGIPLVVEELLAGLLADGALARAGDRWQVASRLVPRVPLTLVESVQRRLRSLDPPALAVVRAAAVLGDPFEWSLLPAVTGLAEADVVGALRQAHELQVLAVDEVRRFRFHHALGRDAVLDELLPPERARYAAAALEAVEAAHPDLEGDWLTLAADLAVEAGHDDQATGLLVEAARRALRRGALSSAGADIERARALASADLRLDLDEVAAQAAALRGEVDRALDLGRSALDAATSQPAERRGRLHLALARALLGAGRWDEAAKAAEEAVTLGSEAADLSLTAGARAAAALAAVSAGRLEEARALAEEAVKEAEVVGASPAACEALEVLGRIARLDDIAAAERHFQRALDLAERHDLPLWRARALSELGTIDLFTTLRRDRLVEARRTAPPALLALIDLHLASIGHARWEGHEAHEAATRCVDLSRRLGLATLGMGLIHLATSAVLARRPQSEVDAAVAEALEVAGDHTDVVAGVPGRVRFLQALVQADFRTARRHLDEAMEILQRDPATAFPFRGLWALLRTVDDAGGAEARREALEAAGSGAPVNWGIVRAAEAVAAGRAGHRDEAEVLHAEALAAMTAGGTATDAWRGMLAVVHLLVAPEALRDGWGDGAAWLREALADLDDLGLVELASAARAALRDAGQPVPRRGRGDSDVPPGLRALGVTSREVDVARLLADRLSNREIAERLSLSPRTVERHVANLLVKTGAADRHEVAALVAAARSDR